MTPVRSYRCSLCDANWIVDARNRECPKCGHLTWSCNDAADRTRDDADKARGARPASQADTPLPGPSPAHANRVDRYLDMGFSQVDAELMATCKDGKGFYLYHHDIRRQLDAGLTHALAVQIYA